MTLPFYFKGKLKDALNMAIVKQAWESEGPRRLQGYTLGFGRLRLSGSRGLHGDKFYEKWDKIHGIKRDK